MAHASVQVKDRLADFTRDRRILVLSGLSLFIGVMSALVAYALVWLIAVITNISFYQRFSTAFISPAENHLGWLVVLVPAIGGLIIGFLAYYGSEKIRGHGIPEALEAILISRSRMDLKVALLKPLASAISIGTGGPFGAEGPIIMTGGAFGSLFAQAFRLSAAERKTLLVAGAAGGMSAIFATPLAALLLSVELLLFEWKPRSVIPVAIACVVAAGLRVPLLGPGPIFPLPLHAPMIGEELLMAAALGLIAGLASGLLTTMVYFCEDMFAKLPIHWMWWPVLGGLVVGVGGIVDPRVLGVGYDTIHALLRGQIVGVALLGLLIGKSVVWSVALGSGTSGGVLAPLLIMGGALGALVGHVLPIGDIGLWSTLGMASMMGGTMRSPLTSIVFALELTHDINVLPGLLISCIAAYALTVLLLRRSILTEKVARHGHHIIREYSIDPLELVRVEEVMDKDVVPVPATMLVSELSDAIAQNDPILTRRQGVPICDAEGSLVGIITRGDVLRAIETHQDGLSVLDAGTGDLVVAYPDEVLSDAVARMIKNDIGRLPVVQYEDPKILVGFLSRSCVMAARLSRHHEENLRETGWLRRFARHVVKHPRKEGPA